MKLETFKHIIQELKKEDKDDFQLTLSDGKVLNTRKDVIVFNEYHEFFTVEGDDGVLSYFDFDCIIKIAP